jgi:Xaa-Pro aminopeptidase
MNDIFSDSFFRGNRQSISELLDSNLIVLAANGMLQRSADTTFPFRQESNFWYLTGLNEPDYVLVINGTSTFLISPRRGEHRDQWDGTIDKKTLSGISGISDIEEYHEGWVRLDLLIKKYKKIHTIAPAEAYLEHFGFYANPGRGHLLEALKKHRKAEIVDIRKALASMRQIKQGEEIKALQAAIDTTISTLQDIKKNINSYNFEYEVAADLAQGFIRRGAEGHAYQPIVASASHASTIHYISNNAAIKKNQFLLLDVGAEVSNYSADITRTIEVGSVSKRHKDIYEAVVSVKHYAENLLKPGILMKEYEQKVDEYMARQLKKLKLLNDINDKRKLKKFYPHLTSHFLGLDTHDAADYFKELKPGMVLTVEPGIYLPDEGIGVRIEDDVLITENGITNLCSALPITLS